MDLYRSKWYPELDCSEWIDSCEVLITPDYSTHRSERWNIIGAQINEVFRRVRLSLGCELIKVVEHENHGDLGIFCIIVRQKDLDEFYKDMINEPENFKE